MRRVLIAEKNRLLREMLTKAMSTDAELEIVPPPDSYSQLPVEVKKHDVDWIIISMTNGETLPLEIVEILIKYPEIGVLEVGSDGSPVRVKWLEIHEHTLTNISFSDLVKILADDVVLLEKEVEKE